MGATVMASQHVGAKNDERVHATVHSSIAFSLLIGAWLAFVWPSNQLGATDSVRISTNARRALDGVGILAFVGLEAKAGKRAAQLSGGEQQRVAVARAVANRPRILLADEPCGNLDRENGKNLISLFKKLAEAGVCVVMVTHNAEDAAEAGRIVTFSDGRVLSDTGGA